MDLAHPIHPLHLEKPLEQLHAEIPTVHFEQFMHDWRVRYRQDQHVTIIGPTGCGKTTLATELIRQRGHVVAFGVKYKDSTMNRLIKKEQWHKCDDWRRRPRTASRIVLWPNASNLETVAKLHQKTFGDALRSIYRIGHWTIWIDELTYLADHVGLKKLIRQMYMLARSNRISIVASAQRPAFVPLEAYSQASHLILFKTGDERDLTRIGSMNGHDSKRIANTVSMLPRHYFLHVDLTDPSYMVISKAAG